MFIEHFKTQKTLTYFVLVTTTCYYHLGGQGTLYFDLDGSVRCQVPNPGSKEQIFWQKGAKELQFLRNFELKS